MGRSERPGWRQLTHGWKAGVAAMLLTLAPQTAWAQCMMCARALKSEEGELMISAFRGGILLMLVVPFALVAIVGTLAVRRFQSARSAIDQSGQ